MRDTASVLFIALVTALAANGGSGSAFGALSDLATFRPVATAFSLATPFSGSAPHVLVHTWTGSEPRGTYVVFLAAFLSGALTDGRLDPGDFITVGAAIFTVGP